MRDSLVGAGKWGDTGGSGSNPALEGEWWKAARRRTFLLYLVPMALGPLA